MTQDLDVLRMALARSFGYVAKEAMQDLFEKESVSSASAAWGRMLKAGLLSPAAISAVDAHIRVLLEEQGATVEGMLAALDLDAELRRFLAELCNQDSVRETILEWKGKSTRQPETPPTMKGFFKDGERTLVESDSGSTSGVGMELRVEQGGKYVFRDELGRGGLGKVVEAVDRDFGREVAVKMMLPGHPSEEAVERFLLEGRAAGRLSHPNIVPIHEIGVLQSDQGAAPYFTMTKIVGHDLGRILRALERGSWVEESGRQEAVSGPEGVSDENLTAHRSLLAASPRKRFNRPRLLRIFQEVCNAMAYAHDHGVLHRDLKPANIMVGDYGEVYVVDWGLAKILGRSFDKDNADGITNLAESEKVYSKEISPPDSCNPRREPVELTLEGQVMGTPAYMSPEQALGRISEVDRRSDIYSLGAILYEILTFRPPFGGNSAQEVISKLLQADAVPPSERVSELRSGGLPEGAAKQGSGSAELPAMNAGEASDIQAPLPEMGGVYPSNLPDSVPPELDDIVMRAMARDRGSRYASARALSEGIQAFLEGEKQRQRDREIAQLKVAKGRELVEGLAALHKKFKQFEKVVEQKESDVQNTHDGEAKREYWRMADELEALRQDVVRTFSEAGSTFQEALGFERENSEARNALADLFWGQFLREEEIEDVTQMIYFEGLVRKFNDGQYDSRLKGDGTLAVSTKAYSCDCFRAGRRVAPDEFNVVGYHPLSGRPMNDSAHPGIPELEPKETVSMKVHRHSCNPEPVSGADVWLFRNVERDLIFVPEMPKEIEIGTACSESAVERGTCDKPILEAMNAAIEALFTSDSPFRPTEGLYLGRTPIEPFSLPMGSYAMVLSKPKFEPVRSSILVSRLSEEEAGLTLFRNGDLPKGFRYVPGEKYVFQGDKGNNYSSRKVVKEGRDFFMGTHPVTCAEYLEFLNDLVETNPEAAVERVPRQAEGAGPYWPRGSDGRYVIPTEAWLETASEEEKAGARRLSSAPLDWEEDWPVMGVSWFDGMAYSHWQRKKTGFLVSLVHDVLWEAAGRGADGRFFPWGKKFEASFCNNVDTHAEGMRPVSVGAFPVDESPYGIIEMSGSCREWSLNHSFTMVGWQLIRGGSWTAGNPLTRCSYRSGLPIDSVFWDTGLRMAVYPKLWEPEAAAPEPKHGRTA